MIADTVAELQHEVEQARNAFARAIIESNKPIALVAATLWHDKLADKHALQAQQTRRALRMLEE